MDTVQKQNSAAQGANPDQVRPLTWLRPSAPRSALLFLLLSGVLLSAMAVVGFSYKSRNVFYQLQQEREEHNALDVEWGQLLIEQSTFGVEGRIERKAMEELGMKVPDWSKIIMVRHD